MTDDSLISLQIPAKREYVAAIRALTRSAATLCALTVDDVEDLQMAVDEAATLLLPLALDTDAHLTAEFILADDGLSVRLSVHTAKEFVLDRSGLAWIMLSALAEDLAVVDSDDSVGLKFSRQRQIASS